MEVLEDFKHVRLHGHFSVHAMVKTIIVPRDDSFSTARILRDYDTEVARVVTGHDCYIMVTGLYSATTRKHLRWFLEEFYPWRYIPMDALKVTAGNDGSYITEHGENLLVIGETGEILWAETPIEGVNNKTAVKMAERHMKNTYKWNSYCFADYIGREL